MISNWLNIEYAWVLWVAYAVLYVVARFTSLSTTMYPSDIRWKIMAGISLVVSLALMVIFPLACAIWFFGGCTLYTLWCMLCSKKINPIKAIVGYKIDKNS